MKEIISLYIGQAGIQLSSAIWELFAAEHDISADGMINENLNSQSANTLFYTNSMKQAIPRCLLIDLEPTVIDEVKTGPYKKMFGSLNLIDGFEDSSSIFSRGYFTQGRLYLNEIFHKLNHQLEVADTMQSMIFVHSTGGGTGSGLFSLILEELDNYIKTIKIDLSIHPSSSSQIIVEPYNSMLAEHCTIDQTDINIMVDNDALFKVARHKLMIAYPSYSSINRIVAQTLSIITSSTRYNDYSCTLSEILHNLVPFPRIHYPICTISPLNSTEQQQHTVNSIYCITKDALSDNCKLLSCDLMEGKFMSCCLMYRGNINSGDIHEAIKRLKCYENLKFVDWCPTGIKVNLCTRAPIYVCQSKIGVSDRLLAVISNNSSVTDPILYNTFRFQLLFQKRAFVHWFVAEGMEEDEFKESLENIACLIRDYEECTLSYELLDKSIGSFHNSQGKPEYNEESKGNKNHSTEPALNPDTIESMEPEAKGNQNHSTEPALNPDTIESMEPEAINPLEPIDDLKNDKVHDSDKDVSSVVSVPS